MSGESQNVLRSKTTNRQTASKLRLLMLLYQGWYLHKEKETSFLTLFMANFWLDGDFFVRNLDTSMELCQ